MRAAAQPVAGPDTAVAGAVRAIGHFLFRFRDYVVPCAVVLMLAATRPEYPGGSETLDRWTDALGLAVALAGQMVRILVIGYAYIRRGGINKQLAAPTLVCEGFFAHSRNPMYLGNILLLTGLAVVYNSPCVYLIGLPLVLGGILTIIRAEEHFLAERFGAEYEAYCRRVNRFLPNPRGIRTTIAGMRFDWKRVLRKDYNTAFLWVSAAYFFLIWERLTHFGYAARREEIDTLVLAYAPLPMAYVTVRFFKKHRWLRS